MKTLLLTILFLLPIYATYCIAKGGVVNKEESIKELMKRQEIEQGLAAHGVPEDKIKALVPIMLRCEKEIEGVYAE